MQHHRLFDPVHQTAEQKSVITFRNKMIVRYQKFKESFDRLLEEFKYKIPFDYDEFPQFPYDEIWNHALEKAISELEAKQQVWANRKKELGKADELTETKCNEHADQQYVPEGDFFAACFSHIHTFIENICGKIRITENMDWRLRQEIQLLMNERSILILLKRTNRSLKATSSDHPIIRCKSLEKSTNVHTELQKLCPKLLISDWIAFRKQELPKNKRAIGAKIFYKHLIKYVEYLYFKQYQIVKGKVTIQLDNIYSFNDQKRLIICNPLEQTTNNIKIDNVLEYFGQTNQVEIDEKSNTNLTTIIPINNDVSNNNEYSALNSIFGYDYNMNMNESMSLSTPSLVDPDSVPFCDDNGSIYDSNSIISSANMYDGNVNNNNSNNYQGSRASSYSTKQARYSPMNSAMTRRELEEENRALKTELNRLRPELNRFRQMVQFPPFANGIMMNYNVQQQHLPQMQHQSMEPLQYNNNYHIPPQIPHVSQSNVSNSNLISPTTFYQDIDYSLLHQQ